MFDGEFACSSIESIARLYRNRASLFDEAVWLERDVPPDDARLVDIAVAVAWLTDAGDHLWRRLRVHVESGILRPAGRSRPSPGGRGSFAPTPGRSSDDDGG